MAHAKLPGGGGHALPEIYVVEEKASGVMLVNDTLPVKMRDWWAVGVGTYVGVGKNKVL